jgi:hypothetical protein
LIPYVVSEVAMEKPKKEPSEEEVLAALLKVKPTADMPRPGPTKKATKAEGKPTK